MKLNRGLFTIICLVSFGSLAAKPSKTQKIQDEWKKTKTYSAEFEQTVTSKLLGTEEKTSGSVLVKKPDKFRWEQKNDGGLQLISGKELLLVQPNAQRGKTVVTRYKDISKALDPAFIGLLSGTIDLAKHFDVTTKKDTDKSLLLQLKPKSGGSQSYLAEFSKNRYFLTSLSFESQDNKTVILFKNIKTNIPADDSKFTYKIGKDDIVYDQ